MLKDKKIILGVCGGIAVYKAVELLRLLTKAGADVHVIMTAAAQQFVTPLTFQTLSGNPVHSELFSLISEREIGHISLADCADLFIIAPATANVIGKVANGIADDLLTTTIMATKAPVLFAPAMNVNMYTNPIYLENERKLKNYGYLVEAAITGSLACGWEGAGKLASPESIFENALTALTDKDFAGRRVLVSAGPTREEVDPVRYISNHSSGKMGYAIAQAAKRRGAAVTLVTGPTALQPPIGIDTVPVNSADDMYKEIMSRSTAADIIIKSAAVADYRPSQRSSDKMKKSADSLEIKLVKNPDILAELGKQSGHAFLVGFAAETDKLMENAAAKLSAKNVDMLVANDVSQTDAGFNVDTNRAVIFHKDGRCEILELMKKDAMANIILDRIIEAVKSR